MYLSSIFDNTTFELLSSIIYFIRSSGKSGSIGKYAAPDFKVPKIAIIISNERLNIKATISFDFMPFSILKKFAILFALY